MSDSDTVQSAYAEVLDKLFSIYFDALAAANGDAATEARALTDFTNGVALARRARDRALAAVAPD